MHPKKASGAPNSTHRTRPSLYNNNNHNKNPRIHPQSSNPPKQYKKPGRPMDPLTFILFFYTILPELLKYTQQQPKCTPTKASGAPNSTLRTRPSLYNNNNNNNNKNPRIHPQSSNPRKHYKKPSVLWTPLRL